MIFISGEQEKINGESVLTPMCVDAYASKQAGVGDNYALQKPAETLKAE